MHLFLATVHPETHEKKTHEVLSQLKGRVLAWLSERLQSTGTQQLVNSSFQVIGIFIKE